MNACQCAKIHLFQFSLSKFGLLSLFLHFCISNTNNRVKDEKSENKKSERRIIKRKYLARRRRQSSIIRIYRSRNQHNNVSRVFLLRLLQNNKFPSHLRCIHSLINCTVVCRWQNVRMICCTVTNHAIKVNIERKATVDSQANSRVAIYLFAR